MDLQKYEAITKLIRYLTIVSTTQAGSGHPTSTLSATDFMTRLFFKYLKYDLDHPEDDRNDRVIFSKGHASSLFYLLYLAAGKLNEEDIMKYRTFDSPLEGHPTRRFPFTEAATGSLGQGLAVGLGEALALRLKFEGTLHPTSAESNSATAGKPNDGISSAQFDANPEVKEPLPKVYVLLGDGEMAEGSVWEAMELASFYKVNNLIAILDLNRLALADPTMYEHDTLLFRKRAEAFGWGAIVIDGHNPSEIDAAYEKALAYKAGPTLIIAKTFKGRGISFLENKDGWHGKVLSKDDLEKAKAELGDVDHSVRGTVAKPERSAPVIPNVSEGSPEGSSMTSYDKPVATRKAFGNALVRLGKNPNVVVFDADVKPSTYTEFFAKAYPERFFQSYISEQTMAGMAVGFWRRGYIPWIATFASFLSRAFDQLRMASVSDANIKINGSHAGVNIGQDGASQMGLEDLAMFRAIRGTTVVYPSDPYETEKLMDELTKMDGMVYVRSTRAETPVLYTKDQEFRIGGSVVHLPKNGASVAVIVAAGITLHESLKAQKSLEEEHISVTVIDAYSIKPIDGKTIKESLPGVKGLIVAEDHYPEGGLGEAVLSALKEDLKVKYTHLAVRKAPRSGKPEELLAYEEIDAAAIAKAVKESIR